MKPAAVSASCPHCQVMLTRREQKLARCPVCRRMLSSSPLAGDGPNALQSAWTCAFLLTLFHGLACLGVAILFQWLKSPATGTATVATVGCLLLAASTVLLSRRLPGLILLTLLTVGQALHLVLLIVALGPRKELLQPGWPLERLFWSEPQELTIAACIAGAVLLGYVLTLTGVFKARRSTLT